MYPLNPNIHDARGARRPLHALPGRRLAAGPADLPPDISRRIRASISAKDPTAGSPHVAERLSIVLILVWIAAMLAMGITWRFVAPLCFALLLLAVIFIFATARRFALRREIAHAYLQERFCPSCAYDLRTSEPDPDGCTICAECGAAWKLPAAPPKESPA